MHVFNYPKALGFYTITILICIPLAFYNLEDTIRGQRTMGLPFDFGTAQKGVPLTRLGALWDISGGYGLNSGMMGKAK